YSFVSRRRRHTRFSRDWSSDVCSSDLQLPRTEMTPRDGVYATSALLDAGARPDDQVSSPNPNAAKLAAVAVPEPFDEPEANAARSEERRVGQEPSGRATAQPSTTLLPP